MTLSGGFLLVSCKGKHYFLIIKCVTKVSNLCFKGFRSTACLNYCNLMKVRRLESFLSLQGTPYTPFEDCNQRSTLIGLSELQQKSFILFY